MRGASVMSPSQLAACLLKLSRVICVDVLHFFVCGDELLKGCLRGSCVFVHGWVCHGHARVSIECDECILVAVFISGIVLG
eukprot:5734787-Pyramimonas_sp.AAC.1